MIMLMLFYFSKSSSFFETRVFRNSLRKVSENRYKIGHRSASFSFSSSLKFVSEKFRANIFFSLKYAKVVPHKTKAKPTSAYPFCRTLPVLAPESPGGAPPYVVTDST